MGADSVRDNQETGGTGYIGTRLMQMLVGRGHRPRVLTREASVARVIRGMSAFGQQR